MLSWTGAAEGPGETRIGSDFIEALIGSRDERVLIELLNSRLDGASQRRLHRHITAGYFEPSDEVLQAALPGLAHWIRDKSTVSADLRLLAGTYALRQQLVHERLFAIDEDGGEVIEWMDDECYVPASPASVGKWAEGIVSEFEQGCQGVAELAVESGETRRFAGRITASLNGLRRETAAVAAEWERYLPRPRVEELSRRMSAAILAIVDAEP